MRTSVATPVPLPRARALVVEDEGALGRLVASHLSRAGYDAEVVRDGREAIVIARADPPDVVVLDLGLPGADGIEVCRTLLTLSDCYVIFLTASVEEVDRLIGLSVGADDYLAKPFSPREPVACGGVMLRRPRKFTDGAAAPESVDVLTVGELTMDHAAREVRVSDRLVELTRTLGLGYRVTSTPPSRSSMTDSPPRPTCRRATTTTRPASPPYGSREPTHGGRAHPGRANR